MTAVEAKVHSDHPTLSLRGQQLPIDVLHQIQDPKLCAGLGRLCSLMASRYVSLHSRGVLWEGIIRQFHCQSADLQTLLLFTGKALQENVTEEEWDLHDSILLYANITK